MCHNIPLLFFRKQKKCPNEIPPYSGISSGRISQSKLPILKLSVNNLEKERFLCHIDEMGEKR
jgi:hypothetical protein